MDVYIHDIMQPTPLLCILTILTKQTVHFPPENSHRPQCSFIFPDARDLRCKGQSQSLPPWWDWRQWWGLGCGGSRRWAQRAGSPWRPSFSSRRNLAPGCAGWSSTRFKNEKLEFNKWIELLKKLNNTVYWMMHSAVQGLKREQRLLWNFFLLNSC